MKTYPSMLLAATHKIVTARRSRERAAARALKAKLSQVFRDGFWFCDDHQGRCERVEDDHGQPAHCDACGSHRLTWVKPVWLDTLESKEAA